MRITKKGQYALFFMIDLALHEGETITVKRSPKTMICQKNIWNRLPQSCGRQGL